jgi:malonyl-CoA/methylmalonyl-CoA synthetase
MMGSTSQSWKMKKSKLMATAQEKVASCYTLRGRLVDQYAVALCLANGSMTLIIWQKGVLLPTSVIAAQARSLIEAWKYTNTDLLLHLLPLHHIHGAINGLFAPLMAGSAIEFLFPFNADATWKRLACPYLPVSAASSRRPITFLTAVPTIYDRLLQTHACLEQEVQEAARTAISPINLRLNMCGSAPLPTSIRADWTRLSHGNVLLERYGMTEVGMALSCGLDPADRVDGSVGWPLPSVEARLVDVETNQTILEGKELDQNGKEREGEIQLRGPTVFRQYWRNSKATEAEFVCDNDKGPKWFKTGDVATRKSVCGAGHSSQPWAKGPMYFIRGRKSVDIIKSGGEKVSALEVERELLSLPQVSEVVVVGIPSEKWGQKIVAVTVLNPVHAHSGKGGKRWAVMDMRRALRDKLANYKIPQELKVVASIPRNAMGKGTSHCRSLIFS